MVDFPKPLKNLWNDWDIRVFVLISLLLQILLIMFASLRRRKASKFYSLFIWSVYLLADWVAAFALGLLCNSQGKSDCNAATHPAGVTKFMKTTGSAVSRHSPTKEYNDKLLAFWAPFLLLHLGGPDTITAFAMEDNELWPRHLLGLMFEVVVAVYVFLLSIPKNSFIAPTLLMFLAGFIKYSERTYALYKASLDGFRKSMLGEPDPGPNYAKLMEEYASKLDSGVSARIDISVEPKADSKTGEENEKAQQQQQQQNGEVKRIEDAHKFFNKFKGLIVELIFSFHERNESQTAFLQMTCQEAFRVVEYELSFVYEVLFTKAVVVHTRCGYVLRFICSCSILGAFLSFFFLSMNHKFSDLDKAITYTLLGGAISLDAGGFMMLILSDWTIVNLPKFRLCEWISRLLVKIPPRNRWSVTMTQHNLINYCIPKEESCSKRVMDRPTILGKVDEILCIQRALRWIHIGEELMDEIQYTWREDVTDALKEFIFADLRKRAEGVKNLKETRQMCSCKGDWALNERGYFREFGYSVELEFDESLLLWHIATDLCYYDEEDMGKEQEKKKDEQKNKDMGKQPEKKKDEQENKDMGEEKEKEQGNRSDDVDKGKEEENKDDIYVSNKASEHRRFCKLLSDYLAYLLVMRPFMMSSSAVIGKIRYRDTCEEAKKFFLRRTIEGNGAEEKQRNGCSHLLSVNTEVAPIKVKGDRSKSVLFDACILAKKLKTLKVGKRWEMMCEVWTEMLIYAAGRCPGIAHAQRLSKGGELLTFVWFLMTHLGLGEKYQIEAGHARAKLTVDK